jgi:UDPglucose--hexose-1-phosphate uridylyltransferase
MPFAAAHKTLVHLADGRELIYFDAEAGPDAARAAYPDTRPLDARPGSGESRFDPLLGEWAAIAANRQVRPYHPGPDVCPFCPSTSARHTEIPAPDYEVAVFENRFPSLSGSPEPPDELIGPLPHRLRRGGGRCEVVAFTSDHDATFASLGEDRVQLVLAAWTDRTANLFALPGIQQVYVFENAGPEIGVTINHPHGQIYAFPYLTPKMSRVVQRGRAHAARTGGNLHDDVLAAELAGGRVVLQNAEWVAFVPFAARWPYEAHLYPRRRVPDFTGLDDAQRAAFPAAYLDLLRMFQRLFGADAPPVPYIAAWYQAPSAEPRAVALHVEVFTVRRGSSPGRLTYLAGTESGMGAFMQDIAPERAADRLRAAAAGPVPAGDLGQLPGRRVVAQRRVPLAHPGHRRALVRLRRPGQPVGQRTWATTSGR